MTGVYNHTLDAKGRLFIPAKLRDELGSQFYVTKGLDNCLFVYPEKEWDEISERIAALPLTKSRNLQRMLSANATKCDIDAQGRIIIPPVLRAYAGLDKDVTILGVIKRAEIWDSKHWDEINNTFTSESMAADMEELGF
jgi:MraZ protein